MPNLFSEISYQFHGEINHHCLKANKILYKVMLTLLIAFMDNKKKVSTTSKENQNSRDKRNQ